MDGRWVNFEKDEPEDKPPEYVEGVFDARILRVTEKISEARRIRYWQWTFGLEGIHDDFRLFFVTPYEDHVDRLAELYTALEGVEPSGQIFINPLKYINKTVCLEVKGVRYGSRTHSEITKITKAR